MKIIAAVIIAAALSTLPDAGRADVTNDQEQQAAPATETAQVAREHVTACDCRAARVRTGTDDRQQVDRAYDPWSDPSSGYQGY